MIYNKHKMYFLDPNSNQVNVKDFQNSLHYTLPIRLDLRNHSPDGFAWGYGGSGPAQLALAIAADLFNDEFALTIYQQLKCKCIQSIPRNSCWELSSVKILEALDIIKPESRFTKLL